MKKLTIYFTIVLAFLCLNTAIFGQTNPTPFDLSSGNYSFTGFADGTITSYPASLQGHSFAAEPSSANLTNEANSDRFLVISTNATTTGSIRNEVANGLSLLNSGSNNIGAIVAAINTTGRNNITVGFKAQQLNDSTSRINGLRLQYRIGTTGIFTDVSPTVEYLSTLSGTNVEQTFSGIVLPTAVDNQPVVQVRWIYYTSLGSGARDRIRLDDISISSSAATSNIDLTITRDASDTTIFADDSLFYDLAVSNGGTSDATGVKANFVIPAGLNYVGFTADCGFSAVPNGSTVSFTGGTVNAGATCNLQVETSADGGGFVVISAGADVTVDPDGTITETNETNNTAANQAQTIVLFPSTVVGLYGRASLAELIVDINDIGGVSTIILDQNLTETSNIVIPDGITIDFADNVVSGNITFAFGSGDGAGFRTAHPNGLGDAAHPGSLQVTQVIFDGVMDVTYYQFAMTLTKLGSISQTAYNNPTNIGDFRIDNPNGLVILAPFDVSGSFYLTNGVVNNGANTITLAEFARINGENGGQGSETSYVAGKMTKTLPFFGFNTENGFATNFTFPVGTLGGEQAGYSPLRVSNFSPGLPNSGLTVQAFDTNSPGVRTPSLSRYWQIDELGDLTTDMQFFWRGGDDAAITNPSIATIIRNGQIVCDGNCTVDVPNRTASITNVSEFSPWSVAQTGPTAAGASISGRVLNSRGFAESRAKVYVTDQDGNTRTTTTNNFGNYSFDGLRGGETYIVNVIVKQAQYNSRIVTLNEDATNLDFIPQE